MAKKKKKQKLFDDRKVMYAYIALFVIASLYVGTLVYYSVAYANKVYSKVKVANTDVGGKTKDEVTAIITKKIQEAQADVLVKGEKEYKIPRQELGVSYDIPKTVENALSVGKKDETNPIKKYDQNVLIVTSVDKGVLSKKISGIIAKENKNVSNAEISLKNGKIVTSKETIGKKVLYVENMSGLTDSMANLEDSYDLRVETIKPEVTENAIVSAEKKVNEILSRDITLKEGSRKFDLTQKDIISFLSFQKGGSENRSLVLEPDLWSLFPAPDMGSNVAVGFNKEKIRDWALSFSNKVDTEAKNAKLSGGGGGVTVISSSVDGKKIVMDDFVDRLASALEKSDKEVEIPVQTTKAEVRDDNLAELGLKGLVSTGWTDFSGSPANRKVNISVGASKFNGVLIKPGEKFSFNTTLGPVEAYTGYLPELVILKDKTVPQYGGGLCQVSSTAFRAALNAGMPIISRSAHAYPVGYYKPYGVDATIYLPSPDLIFQNDTPGYVLIQTHINGNKLYFDFYGTKKDVTIKFSGDKDGTVGVSAVAEGLTPVLTEQEARGKGSFTATFYRHLYDSTGKHLKSNYWISRYDSPDKYPH